MGVGRVMKGGANLHPENAFYNTRLVSIFSNIFTERRETYAPIKERSIDVLYRSTWCHKGREDAAGTVRRIVEQAGFTFAVNGLCGGTGYPNNKDWKPESRAGWATCEECKQSKIVLAFERYYDKKLAYLSEKLFHGFENGAIPAYHGTGEPWIDLLTVNRNAFINRASFDSDEAFAHGIVALLRNTQKIQRMQEEHVFTDIRNAKYRALFWKNATAEGSPELTRFINTSPSFAPLRKRRILTYYSTRANRLVPPHVLQYLFEPQYLKRVYIPYGADLYITGCCF